MSNQTPSQDEFYTALHGLLPDGEIWPDSGETCVINRLLQSVAFGIRELDIDATEAFNDVLPDAIGGFLDDWERVLSLPKTLALIDYFKVDINACGDPLSETTIQTPVPSTDEERSDIILAMLNNNPLNNAGFYDDIASIFGIEIVVADTAPLEWTITIISGATPKLGLFTALANFFKPAHTKLTIVGGL